MKHIRKNYTIETPDDFQRVPLPYFDEWLADLKTNPKQGHGQLRNSEGEDCCLCRLSLVQGRLTQEKNERWYDGDCNSGERKSFVCLSEDNPCVSVFQEDGQFPLSCYVHTQKTAQSFVDLNDSLGLTMLEIADVLEILFCSIDI